MPTLTMDPPRVLVGRSPKVQSVLQQIEKVSSSRWPVLILGETGTGKELIAKNLHSRSTPGPFVVVDCSSLVGPLMESELFGHEKGAFTGAVGLKTGLFEAANGGTDTVRSSAGFSSCISWSPMSSASVACRRGVGEEGLYRRASELVVGKRDGRELPSYP